MDNQSKLQLVPHEIIVDILSRVPAKTLNVDKAVSREWKLCLENHHTIWTHLQRWKEKPGYLIKANNSYFHMKRSPATYYPLYFLPNKQEPDNVVEVFDRYLFKPSTYSVIDSCNGFICMTEFRNLNDIRIYNPAIKKYFRITKPATPTFDLAFGCDSINRRYKLFRLSLYHPTMHGMSKLEILTVGEPSIWREKALVPYISNRTKHLKTSREVHWLLGPSEQLTSVLSINITTEELVIRLLPDCVNLEDPYTPYLIELNGSLAVCMINKVEMQVYVLQIITNTESTWIRKYHFGMPNWVTRAPIPMKVHATTVRDNEILLSRGRSKLVFFNLETKASRIIPTSTIGKWTDLQVLDHFETLLF